MKTAKALGILKGQYVVTNMGFVGIVEQQVNTATPMLEVWGLEHEMGSAYAEELVQISATQFLDLLRQQPCWLQNRGCKPYGKESIRLFKALGIEEESKAR